MLFVQERSRLETAHRGRATWCSRTMTKKYGTLTSKTFDWFLGLDVFYYNRDKGTVTLHQANAIIGGLEKFNLKTTTAVATPATENYAPEAPHEADWLSSTEQKIFMSIVVL